MLILMTIKGLKNVQTASSFSLILMTMAFSFLNERNSRKGDCFPVNVKARPSFDPLTTCNMCSKALLAPLGGKTPVEKNV